MTATTKSFTAILDAALAAGKPIDQTMMTAIRDSLQNLHERLGGSYASNVMDHIHDGIGSAKIQVGNNMLRNGDFENGLTGWTGTTYTGGTIATSTQDADGTASVQITSTVLANGGGDILSNEFMVCVGGASYDWSMVAWASVANVSAKLEFVFYDQSQAAVSTSLVVYWTGSPTSATRLNGNVAVPATARYMKIRATGGIPSVGSATGTVYFDAIYVSLAESQVLAGTSNLATIPHGVANAGIFTVVNEYELSMTTAGTNPVTEIFNSRINVTGTYRVAFSLNSPVGTPAPGQIYKNGVAYGTQRSSSSGVFVEYTEDLVFNAGDTVQLFVQCYSASGPTLGVKNFGFRLNNNIANNCPPPSQLALGLR